MANSKRKCKHCKEFVTEWIKLPIGTFCNVDHAMLWSKAKRVKDSEKAIKKRNTDLKKKVRHNPRAIALEAAQALARISRADDDGYCTCVTCGHVGKWNDGFDGGHYIAKGSCSYWMLDPRIIWPQCKPCNGNGMKFGNKEAVFTLFMVDQFDREFVDHIHAMQKTVIKRTAQDYEEFIAKTNLEILDHKRRIGIK